MIVRNDDVAFDTILAEIRTFCELCDRYGFQALHAITPIGAVRHIQAAWDNDRIRRESGNRLFLDNAPVAEYLLARRDRDLFAVHGLWHTHRAYGDELSGAYAILRLAGFRPTYIVPPFNEGEPWDESLSHLLDGIRFSGKECPRLEEYLGCPHDLPLEHGMAYLHSWRFEHGPFTWAQLEFCMKRLAGRIAQEHPCVRSGEEAAAIG